MKIIVGLEDLQVVLLYLLHQRIVLAEIMQA